MGDKFWHVFTGAIILFFSCNAQASLLPTLPPAVSTLAHSIADSFRRHTSFHQHFNPHHNSSSPENSHSHVGWHGFRRFHANDSLIGQPVPCSHEEKLCFQYNMLFNPDERKCFQLDKSNIVDREEFIHGNGHLRSTKLKYLDPCPGYRMAYDDRCYAKEIVRLILCGCPTIEPSLHILGDTECRCNSSTPTHVEQPEEDGKCLVSDLRFPNADRSKFFENPSEDIQGFKITENATRIFSPLPLYTCSSEQINCFSKGKVWVSEAKDCFLLQEKGPCEEDHVVLLIAQAAREGRLEATCMHERGGCPQGHVRMAFDGQCHHQEDLQLILPGKILSNQFGEFLPTPEDEFWFFQTTSENVEGRNSSTQCALKVHIQKVNKLSTEPALYPECGDSDKSKCPRYEVQHEAPKPYLD